MPNEIIQSQITEQLNEIHNRLTIGDITLEEAIEINNLLSSTSILLFGSTILSQKNYHNETSKNIKKIFLICIELYISGCLLLTTPLLSILGFADGLISFKKLKTQKDTTNIPTLINLKTVLDIRRDLLGRKILLLANDNVPLNISEEEKTHLIPYAIDACDILAEYQKEELPEILTQIPEEEKNIINALIKRRTNTQNNH